MPKWAQIWIQMKCKLEMTYAMPISQKALKTDCFWLILRVRAMDKSKVKAWQIDRRMISKPRYYQGRIFDRFLVDLGVIFGRKIEENSTQEGVGMKMKQREQLRKARNRSSEHFGGFEKPSTKLFRSWSWGGGRGPEGCWSICWLTEGFGSRQ